MITKRSIKFIVLFAGCLISGLLLGNRILLAMSLLPLGLIILGLITVTPNRITIRRSDVGTRLWVGDILEIKYEVTVENGLGIVSLYQELPPHFGLAEGNNLKIIWKGFRSCTYSYSYRLRCTKRGFYTLPSIKWEANHILRSTPTLKGSAGEPVELTVQPKIINVRRIRGLPGIAASPFPVIDIARIGVTTTDFRKNQKVCSSGDP
jgi:uncharacterized protein (DUF58 family)